MNEKQIKEFLARLNGDEKSQSRFMDSSLRKDSVNSEEMTAEFSFSSETPVLRHDWDIGDYWEILDHSPESVDMSRFSNSPPFLRMHDQYDQIGVIQGAEVSKDRVLRGPVKFSRSTRGKEAFNDVEDGISTKTSIRASIQTLVKEGEIDGIPVFRATKWTPFEASLVSIPADDNVGLGRNEEPKAPQQTIKKEVVVTEEEKRALEAKRKAEEAALETARKEAIETARKEESKRTEEIRAIAGLIPEMDLKKATDEAIRGGITPSSFTEVVRKAVQENLKTQEIEAPLLTKEEAKRFSISRAILAATTKDWTGAEFEKECSQRCAKRMGKTTEGFFIPREVTQRALSVGTLSKGGALVADELQPQNMIERLHNAMKVRELGARVMTGLVGNVVIPKITGGTSSFWVAEDGSVTESDMTFGQLILTPKTVGASTKVTRDFLLQGSIDGDMLIEDDLALAIGLAIDLASINGSGTNGQPLGIMNTDGINTTTLTIASTQVDPTFAQVVEMETGVAADNALLGNLAYLTNAQGRGNMKVKAKDSGSGLFLWDGGELNGYKAEASQQVPAGKMIFADWGQLIIGMWGDIEINTHPADDGRSGSHIVTALQSVDVGLRHEESFNLGGA